MLQRAMRACGQRFGLQTLLLGYLLLLCFAAPSFAQSVNNAKKTPQATATSAQAQLEGELEVWIEDDFKGKKSHTRHFLKTESGQRYELKFKKSPPQHEPGSKIRVKGTQTGDTLTLESGSSDSSSYQILAAPAPGLSSLGEQKTAVLLVNFQDQPTNKPWTTDQWNSAMFGTASDSLNNFMLENSYQQTWFSGKVFGWYTLPINSTDVCSNTNIAAKAKSAAAAAGVDLSAYSRLLYVFPSNRNCGWAGLSSVGTIPSESFSNGFITLDNLAHELGHALGLQHSHGIDCDISATGNTCSAIEYGDPIDTMGSGYGHFQAVQKERLGWLNFNGAPAITTVQSSGSYVIEPIETGGVNPKALKILKSIDPTSGAKSWYYLEYRQPLGVDSYISTKSIYFPQNVLAGVLVHTATEGMENSHTLLDMTPSSLTAYTGEDLSDPALTVGKSYTDTNTGVTITPTWANNTGIGVDVTFAKSACTHANPSVVMSSQSASVLAGTPVTYTVAVSNNDSSGCAASTFNLQATLPTGWIGVWGTSSLNIGTGSTASATVTVTSSTSSTAGTYSITAKATNSGSAIYTGSGSSSYIIGTTSTTTTTKGNGKGRK